MKYDNYIIKLLIWDTAGQERFRSITKTYIRDACCIILVYDISNKNSFLNLDDWLKFLKKNKNKDSIVVLVGNKNDSENRYITFEEGQSFAINNNFLFFETNIIDGMNINNIFENSISHIFKNLDFKNILLKNKNCNLITNDKKYRYKYNCCS